MKTYLVAVLVTLIQIISTTSLARSYVEGGDNDSKPAQQAPTPPTFQNPLNGQATGGKDFENLRRRLYFDPILNVNTNRGALQTEFEIPLPPGLGELKSLSFHYNHMRAENVGYGVGWTLDLPQITENRDSYSKSEYLISSSFENADLVAVTENDLGQYKIIETLTALNPSLATAKEVKAFRPAVDTTGNLYLQFKSTTGDCVAWVILELSGTRWVLDSNGYATAVFGKNFVSQLITREGPTITGVSDPIAGWNAKFNYSALETNGSKAVGGVVYATPIGLQEIRFTSFENHSRRLLFRSDAANHAYLTQVYWEGGNLPLWQGSYSSLPGSAVDTPIAGLKFEKGKSWIYKTDLSLPEKIDVRDWQVLIDLDGDGREDSIDFNYGGLEDGLTRMFNDMPHDRSCTEEWWRNQRIEPLFKHRPIVQKSLKREGDQTANWIKDETLTSSFPDGIYPLRMTFPRLFTAYDSSRFDLHSITNGLFFVDFSGKGLKSLLYCDGSQSFELSKSKVSHTLFHLAQLKNPNLQFRGDALSDVNSVTGTKARIFVQEVNRDKLQEDWKNEGFTAGSAPRVNTLMNATAWREIEVEGLNCHQESLVFEPWPGQLGVWTGGELYLLDKFQLNRNGTGTPGKIRFVDAGKYPLENFVESENEITQQQIDDGNLMLMPRFGSKPLSLVKATTAVTFGRKGQVALLDNDGSRSFNLKPSQAVLKESVSPFGGKVEVSYAKASGTWVVSETRKVEGSQIWRHVFDYKSELFDNLRNTFIGFSETEENVISPLENIASRKISKEYIKDDVDSVVLYQQRVGRINGWIKSTTVASASGRPLKKQQTEDLKIQLLSDGRVAPYIGSEADQTFSPTDQNKVQTLHHYNLSSDVQTDSKGQKLFVVPQASRSEGSGLKSRSCDSFVDYLRDEMNHRVFDTTNYLLLTKQTDVFGKSCDSNSSPEISTTFEHDPQGNVLKTCKGNVCTSSQVDSYGRVINSFSPTFGKTTFIYQGNTPLVSREDHESFSQETFSDLLTGFTISEKDSSGLYKTNIYDADGILLETQTNSGAQTTLVPTYKREANWTPCSEQTNSICQQEDRSVNWTSNGVPFRAIFDTLGRNLETFTIHDGRWYSLGANEFGESNDPIHRTLPGFSHFGYSFYTAQSDSLGRPLKVITTDGTLTYYYTENCTTSYLNGTLQSKSCTDPAGRLAKSWIDGDEWNIGWNESNRVSNISGIEAIYNYNGLGQLTSTKSDSGPSYWSPSRKVSSPDSRVEDYSDGRHLELNYFGLPIYTKGPSATARNLSVEKRFTYDAKRPVSVLTKIGNLTSTERYGYDSTGRITSYITGPFNYDLGYDPYGRLTKFRESTSEGSLSHEIVYSNDEVVKIDPWLTSVERDPNTRKPIRYNLFNGLSIAKTYDGSSERLNSIEYSIANRVLFREVYRYNNLQKTVYRSTFSASPSTPEHFNYDSNSGMLQSNTSPIAASRTNGKIASLGETKFEWSEDQLTKVVGPKGEYRLFSDASGHWITACQGSSCVWKFGHDNYTINGKPISLVRIDQLPFLVVYEKTQYFVVSDKLGSIRAMYSADGNKLLWERSYTAFGAKSVYFNPDLNEAERVEANDLEKATLWGFAGLIELPFVTSDSPDQQIFLSETRAYSPALQSWLSADTLVKWTPESAVKISENLYPLRYARNQPLDYFDPSGQNVVVAIAVAGGYFVTTMGIALSAVWSGTQATTHIQDAVQPVNSQLTAYERGNIAFAPALTATRIPILLGISAMPTAPKGLAALEVITGYDLTKLKIDKTGHFFIEKDSAQKRMDTLLENIGTGALEYIGSKELGFSSRLSEIMLEGKSADERIDIINEQMTKPSDGEDTSE